MKNGGEEGVEKRRENSGGLSHKGVNSRVLLTSLEISKLEV